MVLANWAAASLVVSPAVLGLLWSAKAYMWVRSIPLDGHPNDLIKENGAGGQKKVTKMIEIAGYISDGATTFLIQECRYLGVYIIFGSVVVANFVGYAATIAFMVGSTTSVFCGWVGMKIACFCNVRTAHEAWASLPRGFDVALHGGSVMGLSLCSIGVLTMYFLIVALEAKLGLGIELWEALAGYGLGGSSVALFCRVGGGIYTKAADVGADLSGKNEYGMDEDDPRNPACIADNVGDNVGDVAGMGADLFGSFAEATCAAMVLSGDTQMSGIAQLWPAMLFPLLISSTGIVVGIITIIISKAFPVQQIEHIERSLKAVLVISTVLETAVITGLAYFCLPWTFAISPAYQNVHWYHCLIAVLCGLWTGLIIGFVTEFYTSNSHEPVREVSESQRTSAATGIIYGLALGYLSCVIPVLSLGITILIAHELVGTYGIALAALGMLSTLSIGLTIDAYGPISDNAGGLAEMAELGPEVRRRTDALDAAGNTTAAIGKGFAIGSAALVGLALSGAFCARAEVKAVDLQDPWTFTGLLFGAMLPYFFSAMTMKAVGRAATDMVRECMDQFPKIINEHMAPQYERCIRISTQASLREMIAPGALAIISPLLAGFLFGKNCTAGLLAGVLVSGVQCAISMSNTGGAWDNAKKYIEAGGLGANHGKGSQAHQNAVTGDTVGDPLKDTSGPSINILMKLTAIVSLVFGSVIAEYSNSVGGPLWAKVSFGPEVLSPQV